MSNHKHAHHLHRRAAHEIRDAKREEDDDQPVVVSVIYVTASKTFKGPIGGYRTLNSPKQSKSPSPDNDDEDEPRSREPKQKAKPKTTSKPDSDPSPAPKSSSRAKNKDKELESESESASSARSKSASKISTKSLSEAYESTATDVPSRPSLASAGRETSSSVSASAGKSAASGAAMSVPSSSTESQTQGMSGGAKAGLAIGILLIIGVLGLLLLCLKRKKDKKKAYEKTDDEKVAIGNEMGASRTQSIQSTRTTATAPRLSLRPVTQFLPDLGARRKSGNLLGMMGSSSPNGLAAPQEQLSEKPAGSAQSSGPVNPFGSHAEVAQAPSTPVAEKPTNPFGNHDETRDVSRTVALSPPVQAPAPLRIRTPTPDAAMAGSAVASSNVGAAREERFRSPNHLNVSPNRPISPAGTEFSMNSVSSGYIANGAPPSNVYRVQLDFNPSMDDELGLQAGQLIRLLHEYDDGWALCIRLDRSQQGVAPRTCLSARPVKPRPAGNNRGPPPRGPPPPPGVFGPGQPRPSSPAGARSPPSQQNREQLPRFQGARPGPRSMSPGPYGGGPQRPNIPPPGGRRRSNSASQVRDRRNSPPGPSPMNPNAGQMQRMAVPMQLQVGIAPGGIPSTQRKPVPGQAI